MTTQPQPTAALSDAYYQALPIVRAEIEAVAAMAPEEKRIATPQNQAVWIVRALSDAGLLARAESAPGVTIPSDIAIYAHTILGDMGPDEVDGDSWPTHVATVRILGDAIDAALADAGPQAE